jgi:hypothetical protein
LAAVTFADTAVDRSANHALPRTLQYQERAQIQPITSAALVTINVYWSRRTYLPCLSFSDWRQRRITFLVPSLSPLSLQCYPKLPRPESLLPRIRYIDLLPGPPYLHPMALDRTCSALELLKPVAKAVPAVGGSLEAAIDLVIQGCLYVKASTCIIQAISFFNLFFLLVQEVRTNKQDAVHLYEHAAVCATAVVLKLRGLPKGERENWISSTRDLLSCVVP